MKKQLALMWVHLLKMKTAEMMEWLSRIVLMATAVGLWHYQDFLLVPNPDIFQYLETGTALVNFNLPKTVQEAPLYPFLIKIVSYPLLVLEIPHPGIKAAVFISSVAGWCTAWLNWKLVKQFLPQTAAFIVLCFLVTNPLFYVVSIDTTPDTVLACLTILSCYWWINHRPLAALGAAFFLALTRYEGLILYGLIAVALSYRHIKQFNLPKKAKSTQLSWLMLGWTSIVLGAWFGLSYYFSQQLGVIHGNKYFEEIVSRWHDLPTWEVVGHIPDVFLIREVYIAGASTVKSIIVAGLVSVLLGYVAFRYSSWRVFVTYTIAYLAVHLMFPAWDDRYLFPVMPLLLLFLARVMLDVWRFFWTKKIKIAKSALFLPLLFLIGQNVSFFASFMNHTRYVFAEYRLAGEWLDTAEISEPIAILAPLNFILDYYVSQPQVHFVYIHAWEREHCQSVRCVIEHYEFTPSKLWVVKDNLTQQFTAFNIKENGILVFTDQEEERCLKEYKRFMLHKRWLTIYEYDTATCPF